MKKILILTFFLFAVFLGKGQNIYIPETIYFAGMRLELNNQVQKTLETEVANLKRNQKYFQMKVDRADLYFPIIEKVFKEENFPDDFKYLALQESSLVSDAVSSSNAVGYWQFKKASAQEVGLRCDNEVDERMNIVSATRGAAKYLKRNNVVLKNWVYALLSYNLGLGGVQREVDEKYVGANTMKINNRMHWYVIRFLAHKLAFEGAVGKVNNNTLRLLEYSCTNKSLREISKETNLTLDELENYNKWARRGKVPNDKMYAVILPVNKANVNAYASLTNKEDKKDEEPEYLKKYKREKDKSRKAEKVASKDDGEIRPDIAFLIEHNRLKAIRAKEGNTFEELAKAGDVKLRSFLIYNELKKYEKPVPGEYYYLQAKRNRALVAEHVVKPGENLRDIAQKYGVRSNSLRKKNRMKLNEEPKVGRILHLRKRRKRKEPVRYAEVEQKKKDDKKSANQIKKENKKETGQKTQKTELKEESKAAAEEEESRTKRPDRNTDVNVVGKEPNKKTEAVAVEKEVLKNAGDRQVDDQSKEKAVAESEKESTDADSFNFHFVEPGETLYSLSKKYSVSIDSLNSWNNFTQNGLKAGASIIVGRKDTGSQPASEKKFIEHKVQQGETLYRISKQYGMSIEDILKWNNKSNSSVSVGEILKILSD